MGGWLVLTEKPVVGLLRRQKRILTHNPALKRLGGRLVGLRLRCPGQWPWFVGGGGGWLSVLEPTEEKERRWTRRTQDTTHQKELQPGSHNVHRRLRRYKRAFEHVTQALTSLSRVRRCSDSRVFRYSSALLTVTLNHYTFLTGFGQQTAYTHRITFLKLC